MVARKLATGAVALAAIVALGVPAAPAQAAARYPVGNAATGYATLLVDPEANPPGVNVCSCRPSAAHPRPIVLVPGTTSKVIASWSALGPILANLGYCVYGLNYGATWLTTLSGGRIGAVGDIPSAAAELATFVDRVLSATATSKVDIVGWSQGGMMPRYYLKNLGGASKVARLVGLASSNHGTTVDGLNTLLNGAGALAGFPLTSFIGCPACTQQVLPSAFISNLNAGGDTLAGIDYSVIETRYDEVVTPYTSAFLAGARNILLQDQCPADITDHLGISYDSNALQDVVNLLGPADPSFRPVCGLALPLIGSPQPAATSQSPVRMR
ncbi:MAG: esterase/lipase family protein [Jatrophihabitans sp.]